MRSFGRSLVLILTFLFGSTPLFLIPGAAFSAAAAQQKQIKITALETDVLKQPPGTPIYDEHAEPLAAISLAGPSSRLPDERKAGVVEGLAEDEA